MKYITAGSAGGYKLGETARKHEGYEEAQWEEEKNKRGREYAEAHMSEWIKAGEELVYPERLDSWRKTVESSSKGAFYGLDIAKAIEIMRALESDTEVKDVVETFRGKEHCGGYVEKMVLNFSKRGPEYMEQFMSTFGVELTPQMRERLEALKAENRQYAQNDLARNSAAKKAKSNELEKVSSQLDGLSTENQGKDPNQVVQE